MQQASEGLFLLAFEDGELGGPQALWLPPFAALLWTGSFTFCSFLLLLLRGLSEVYYPLNLRFSLD